MVLRVISWEYLNVKSNCFVISFHGSLGKIKIFCEVTYKSWFIAAFFIFVDFYYYFAQRFCSYFDSFYLIYYVCKQKQGRVQNKAISKMHE